VEGASGSGRLRRLENERKSNRRRSESPGDGLSSPEGSMTMRAFNKLVLGLSALTIAVPQTVSAQSGALLKSWVGTWHLNTAKSKFSSKDFTTKSETRTYTLDGKRLTLRSTSVNAAGKTMKWGYSASTDGKWYPTSGNPNTDRVALTFVSPREFKARTTLKGEPAARSTVTLSADGKELRLARSILTAKGGPTNDTLVYERAK
jgi:hypothetical protein